MVITQNYVFSKTSKKQILTADVTKLRKNQLKIFLQHFSNRPYTKVRKILAYFYIIKTI